MSLISVAVTHLRPCRLFALISITLVSLSDCGGGSSDGGTDYASKVGYSGIVDAAQLDRVNAKPFVATVFGPDDSAFVLSRGVAEGVRNPALGIGLT